MLYGDGYMWVSGLEGLRVFHLEDMRGFISAGGGGAFQQEQECMLLLEGVIF